MRNRDDLLRALAPLAPTCIDAGRRGSGLNGVWAVRTGGRAAILKTYGRRRSRVQAVLTEVSNLLTGRSAYHAAARFRTEADCLRRWRAAGFDVPELLPPPDIALPCPALLMERLEGPTLAAFLAGPACEADKAAAVERLAAAWCRRHRTAFATGERGLIQEHASIDHVLVAGDRLVTIDLETAYRLGTPAALVAAELAALARSFLKRLPGAHGLRWLQCFARAYPDRDRILASARHLLANPNPVCRAAFRVHRRATARPGRTSKYDAAEAMAAALGPAPERASATRAGEDGQAP